MRHDTNVLMIHEVDECIFKKPLDQYILTFDDGLYSQYKLFHKIKQIPTVKIFFISTGIVADESVEQNKCCVPSSQAHEMFFQHDDASCFMKWSQIEQIANTPGCYIGGHSHYHHRGAKMCDLIHDTKKMCEELLNHQIETNKFCFPYNKEHSFYKALLINHGFTDFYSAERHDIDDL